MADAGKITLAEITIDAKAATKEAESLKQTIVLLKDQLMKAKKAGGETSKEYIELQSALKVANKEYNQQVAFIGNSIKADTEKKGSINQLQSQLSIVTAKWKALSEEERVNTAEGQKLSKQKLDLTNALKKEEKATGDSRREVGNYSGGIKEANQALGAFIPGAGRATSAAKTFGIALKVALGWIGLVIAAIAALIAFFKSSEEGQAAFNKVLKIFGVIIGNLSDIVAKFGEKLFNAITKPREAFEALQSRVKEIGVFFQNTFGNIITGSVQVFVGFLEKGFAKVGLAWQKLKDVFVDNSEKVEAAKQKIIDADEKISKSQDKVRKGSEVLTAAITEGWDKAKNAVTGFIEETQREAKEAARLANLKLETDRLERKALVERAKIEAQVAELRLKARQEDQFSSAERLKFLAKANDLQDSLIQKEEEIAKNRLELRKIENSFSKSTKENLDEEARLEAELFKVQTTRLTARRQIERELQRVRKQNEKELADIEKARIDETINNLRIQLEEWKLAKDTQALNDQEYAQQELERQQGLINAKFENELISEQEKNLALRSLRVEFEEEERERAALQAAIDLESDFALAEENLFAQLDLERQVLEQKKEQEIAFAQRIGADTEKINKKFAKAKEKLDQAEFNAKLSLAAGFTKNLATIAGEQTAIGKAAAVAGTSVAAIQSAVNSYNSLSGIPVAGPVLGAAAAAAALISGFAQVKEILSVKSGLPGENSVSASVPSGGAANIPSVPKPPPESLTAKVGTGIVARETETSNVDQITTGVSEALKDSPRTAVITDEVTVNQEESARSAEISSL